MNVNSNEAQSTFRQRRKPFAMSDSVNRGAFTALDLFAGAGGFSLGLVRAKFSVLGAFDNWQAAVKSYAANFEHPVLNQDVSQLRGDGALESMATDHVDLLVGGPPCQGFSIQRIGDDSDGRNSLVLEYARLVEQVRPRLFLMENVPGLLGKRGKVLVQEFLRRLDAAGYRVIHQIVNAADYGVPQIRKRVVFAGWPKGAPEFQFPAATHLPSEYVTAGEALSGLPVPPEDFSPLPGDALHRRTRLSELNQQRIRLIPPGGGMQDLPEALRVDCHRAGAEKIGHRYVYGRLDPDKPSATITARFDSFTRGKFGHPIEPRNMTLREGARLQSFPDTFKFFGTQEEVAAQIGNAVPPLVAFALAQAASTYLSSLGGHDKRCTRNVQKDLFAGAHA